MKNITKYLLTFLILNSSFLILTAQVGINENGNDPDPSAMLDISSTDKGLLIPRMDSTARKNIIDPANGLMVFDSTTFSFWYAQDTQWLEIANEEDIQSLLLPTGVQSGEVLTNDGNDSLYWAPIEELQTLNFNQDLLSITNGDTVNLSGLRILNSEGLKVISKSNESLLDINQSTGGGGATRESLWQSFTPTKTGLLSQVEVDVFGANSFIEGYFRVYAGQGTGGALLGEMPISNLTNGYYTFDLTSMNICIEIGSLYTFQIQATDESISCNLSFENPYSGGRSNLFAGTDYRFRTYYSPIDTNTIITFNALESENASFNMQLLDTLFFSDGTYQYSAPSGDNQTIDNLNLNGTVLEISLENDGEADQTVNLSSLTFIDTTFTSENGITNSFNNDDDFVFGADSLNHGNGTESKFFFDKDKGAFRAGEINNDNWNTDSLGFASFAAGTNTKATNIAATAFGEKTTASGLAATAMGTETIASGSAATTFGNNTVASGTYASAFGIETSASGAYATAFGERTSAENAAATAFGSLTVASGFTATAFGLETEASGSHATVFGESTTASGTHTTAFGGSTLASGNYATAFGRSTTAPSYGETVIGINNTTYTPTNTTGFNENDRLFVVGNGTNVSNRSDALIIYKDGDTEINGAVTIDDSYTLPTTDGTSGEVLSTDGNGNVSWTADKDDQELSFSGTTLSITDGNSVDLSSLVPVGTIQMWATATAPDGWLICIGQEIEESDYPELYQVLGGEDGRANLPNFKGRFPLGAGLSNANGATTHDLTDAEGEETVTLEIEHIPAHTHNVTYGERSKGGSGNNVTDLDSSGKTETTSSAGGGEAHNNMPPFYTINFIIKAE